MSTAIICDLEPVDKIVFATKTQFSFAGKEYELDLCFDHYMELKNTIKLYIPNARKVNLEPKRDRRTPKKIRQWLKDNGIAVEDHGRFTNDQIRKYNEATGR